MARLRFTLLFCSQRIHFECLMLVQPPQAHAGGPNTTEKLRGAVEIRKAPEDWPMTLLDSLSVDLEQAYLHIRCVFGAVRLGSELPYAREYTQFMFQARHLAHPGNQ
jgi:hypothetical protein